MEKTISFKRVLKNCFLSIFVQLVSLVTSFVLGLIVPKFVDELNYAYWQTYIMYVAYTGLLHFGIIDGLVLRYAGVDYQDLDKERIRSQFAMIISLNIAVAIPIILVSYYVLDFNHFLILSLFALATVAKNIFTYTVYLLQITNRINCYAKAVIMQRASYLVAVVLLLVFGVQSFVYYCLADVLGEVCGIFIGAHYNKGLYIGRLSKIKVILRETSKNIKAGINVMIAYLSAMSIVGGAKLIIQLKWGDLAFGKASFSFSIANLFNTFIVAISVVLLPSLKRLNEENLAPLYGKIRNVLSPLMFVALLLYFPMAKILAWWLPLYSESVRYLGILLPMMIFASKTGLLTDTYLKTYRREKAMLWINVGCMALGILIFCLCAYVFNSLDAVIYAVVGVTMLRSVISEIVVTRIFGRPSYLDFVLELMVTVIFIAVARYVEIRIGFLVYLATVIVLVIIKRKTIVPVIIQVWANIAKKKRMSSDDLGAKYGD